MTEETDELVRHLVRGGIGLAIGMLRTCVAYAEGGELTDLAREINGVVDRLTELQEVTTL